MPPCPPPTKAQGCRDPPGRSRRSGENTQATGLSSQISCLSLWRCPSPGETNPLPEPGLPPTPPLHPPPFHPLPLPPGLALRPMPGGGTRGRVGGPGLEGSKNELRGGCRWRTPPPNRRMHGTPSLPCSPAPTARLRSAALGLDGWAGVFWGIDAIGPESSGMALISIAKSSTLSLGPSASPTGAEMLAFLLAGCASHLPAAPEYFPITCRCLAGSSSFLSL